MDQNKPADQIIMDLIKSHSKSTKETRDGWTISTTVYAVCLTCLVEGGEDANLGTTINTFDKAIELSNTIVVDDDQCDYVSEHEMDDEDELDQAVQDALDAAVEKGLVVKTIGTDGQALYQHIDNVK